MATKTLHTTPVQIDIQKFDNLRLPAIEASDISPGIQRLLASYHSKLEDLEDYVVSNFESEHSGLNPISVNSLLSDTLGSPCPFRQYIYLPALKESHYVPCGKCLYCQSKKASMYASRLAIESASGKNLLYTTLTYDEDHYSPISPYHAQNLFKRLRAEGFGFKYMLRGEYGTRSARPHYHALFILPSTLSSQKFASRVSAQWSFGSVLHEFANPATAFYIVGYLSKVFDTGPTFNTYSKRPCIGDTTRSDISDKILESVNDPSIEVSYQGMIVRPHVPTLSRIYGIPENDSFFDPIKKFQDIPPVKEEFNTYAEKLKKSYVRTISSKS